MISYGILGTVEILVSVEVGLFAFDGCAGFEGSIQGGREMKDGCCFLLDAWSHPSHTTRTEEQRAPGCGPKPRPRLVPQLSRRDSSPTHPNVLGSAIKNHSTNVSERVSVSRKS